MKFALWITGLFALAVLVGLAATVNTGYAILFLPPYRMEVSFNLLIVSVIVLIFVVHLVLRMVAVAANLPEEVRRFQRQKKLKAARHALREAGISYFEGRFQKAEREASKSLDNEYSLENKALALLIAARSAGAAGDLEKRDGYLAQLEAMPPRLQLARHMLDAELKLEAKDPLGALAAIERVRALSPNLTNALRLELKVRLLQKQPEAVLALTEKLLKADALEPEQARRYRLAAYQQQLVTLLGGQEIRDWLRRIPEAERSNPQLVDQVVARLIVLQDYDYAATLLAGALANDDHDTPELSREAGQAGRAPERGQAPGTAENRGKLAEETPARPLAADGAGPAGAMPATVGQGAKLSGSQRLDLADAVRPRRAGAAVRSHRQGRASGPALQQEPGAGAETGLLIPLTKRTCSRMSFSFRCHYRLNSTTATRPRPRPDNAPPCPASATECWTTTADATSRRPREWRRQSPATRTRPAPPGETLKPAGQPRRQLLARRQPPSHKLVMLPAVLATVATSKAGHNHSGHLYRKADSASSELPGRMVAEVKADTASPPKPSQTRWLTRQSLWFHRRRRQWRR